MLSIAVDQEYVNTHGKRRRVTEVGPQCSPTGRFADWCTWRGPNGTSGRCSFSTFRAWVGAGRAVEDGPPAAPSNRDELAPRELFNRLRVLEGNGELSEDAYTSWASRHLIPARIQVETAIERLSPRPDPAQQDDPDVEDGVDGSFAAQGFASFSELNALMQRRGQAFVSVVRYNSLGSHRQLPTQEQTLAWLAAPPPEVIEIPEIDGIGRSAFLVGKAIRLGKYDDQLDDVELAETHTKQRGEVLEAIRFRRRWLGLVPEVPGLGRNVRTLTRAIGEGSYDEQLRDAWVAEKNGAHRKTVLKAIEHRAKRLSVELP